MQLSEIDFDDRYYLISRARTGQDFLSSIKDFGVLDPPVVTPAGKKYRVVFGFNRLRALKTLGHADTPVLLMEHVDPEWYVGRALLKCERNECGPIGRLRILIILKEAFSLESRMIERIGERGLRVPVYFVQNKSLLLSAMELPETVKDYIDGKDIQYRTIRALIDLPASAIDRITEWLEAGQIRVNIFKNIVEMLTDICARDGDIGLIDDGPPDNSEAPKRWDEHLLGRVFSVRYPAYSGLKAKADDIVKGFSSRGIKVGYPAYFEGDTLELAVSVRKGEDPAKVREKISSLDLSALKELLDML